jgi:hypothetical protein
MRVAVTLTIDGTKETVIEGEARLFDAEVESSGDKLEAEGLGIWMSNYRINNQRGRARRGRVFIPWTSTLYVEEVKNASDR